MTKQQAIKVLIQYNEWRADNEGEFEMPCPQEIGEAIDTAIRLLSKPAKPAKPKPKRFKWIRLKPAKRRSK